MSICKRLNLIYIILGFSLPLAAQTKPDVTGLWRGTLYNDTTQRTLKYEIAISENKGKLSGYSHTYFIVDDKEFHGVKKVKVKWQDDKLVVEDQELIADNYPIPPAKGVRQLDILTLDVVEGTMTLSGPFSTNRTKIYHSLTGSVQVQRKNNYRQSALIPHLEELGLASDLSFIQQDKIKEAEAIALAARIEKEKTALAKETKATELAKTETATTIDQVKKEESKTVAAKLPVPPPIPVAAAKEKVVSQPVAKTEQPAAIKPGETAVKKANEIKTGEPAKSTEVVSAKVKNIEPPKNTTYANAAVDIENRTIETIQSVNYRSDSLVLTLYDNGEVDGDTVSVLMNGSVIMPMVGLSTNAVRKTIYTKDLPDSIQLVMYAETLGSLPPNTGLLIVYDGTDRYEIRFSGDLKKNAAIVFKRKQD